MRYKIGAIKTQIEELQKQLDGVPNHHIEFKGVCHDCGVPVKVVCYLNEERSEVIEGGALYNPQIDALGTKNLFFKCDVCFQKDKVLRNYQKCEVYSQIVGYLRPVEQWNAGKQEEFKQRKEFVVGGGEKE